MTLEEIKAFLEENKDQDEVKAFLASFKATVDVQKVEELAMSDESIKSWLDSQKDKHSAKSLDTWKSNNLGKLIDEKLKELNPDRTPEQLELDKIKQQLADMESQKVRSELKNKALTVAGESGIPTTLLDFFIGEDEESTLNNLKMFTEESNSYVQKQVEKRLKDNDYTPPSGDSGKGLSVDDFNKLSYTEKVKLKQDEPAVYEDLVGKQ